MDIRGKVAVITGASAGIGAATARELAKAGAKLVLTARRADRLAALAKELDTDTATLAADIADPQTPQRLLDLAVQRFGRADIVVNNAGMLAITPVETVDLDEMTRIIKINFEAVMRASYVFAKPMKAQKSGAIINVSSIAAYGTSPMVAVYAGTKHAVEAFTSSLRIELAGTGVKVGTIAPGSTETDMFDIIRAKMGAMIPAEMPMVTPEDVAQSIRFMIEQPDNVNIARLAIFSSHQTN